MLIRIRILFCLLLVVCIGLLASCKKKEDAVTAGEALQALEEASMATQASLVISGTVEITTDFTIGKAVEAAAQEIHDFIVSTLPCAEITLKDATLTVEYGKKAGNCTYKGQTYTGKHSITVAKNDEGDVQVSHTWTALSNGKFTVSGSANVTWSLAKGSRHVVHTLAWTRIADGRQGTGSGDRTQTTLDGGILEGIEVNGTRKWEGKAGDWDLDIDGVQIRWAAPVPDSGSYTLTTPFDDKTVTLSFKRIDDKTIEVTLESGDAEFVFKVKSTGSIEES